MNTTEAAELVEAAIAFAVAGDAERAADSLTTLGSQSDDNLMYGACCAIAEAGKMMLARIYGDQMAQPEQGDMFVLEELKPGAFDEDPPKAFAAAVRSEGDQYVDSVCTLLADVAGIARLALKQQDGGPR